MIIDKGEYAVLALDAEGFELYSRTEENLKEAKRRAKRILDDPEMADVHKVEVCDWKGECVADFFRD